jgi:hypothetical protein
MTVDGVTERASREMSRDLATAASAVEAEESGERGEDVEGNSTPALAGLAARPMGEVLREVGLHRAGRGGTRTAGSGSRSRRAS